MTRIKKLLFVFGTRPEAIKMAPLVRQAKSQSCFSVHVCVTAQHREMLDRVLDFFEITPDFDLNLMKQNQTLNSITCSVVAGLDAILDKKEYDCILVHGDTSTTAAAALCAFHRKIPVAHVEAGLRTYDLASPWPEELNRRVACLASSLHLAPTEKSSQNLIREGVDQSKILVTGNTVIDALNYASNKLDNDSRLKEQMSSLFPFLDNDKKMVLVTGHRRENFGDGFKEICSGLLELSEVEDVQIVYPVHLNPNVQKPVQEILGNKANIYLIAPQDYLPFIFLMKTSYLIITDSGGVQEEAPSLGKPVLVMRDTTERPEAVEAGTVKLVGSNSKNINKEALKLLRDDTEYKKMISAANPYGDGNASKRIMEFLNEHI